MSTQRVCSTIELNTAQRVMRDLNELDNSDGGSRETFFTVAQRAHS
jgi:hypothetical protein